MGPYLWCAMFQYYYVSVSMSEAASWRQKLQQNSLTSPGGPVNVLSPLHIKYIRENPLKPYCYPLLLQGFHLKCKDFNPDSKSWLRSAQAMSLWLLLQKSRFERERKTSVPVSARFGDSSYKSQFLLTQLSLSIIQKFTCGQDGRLESADHIKGH